MPEHKLTRAITLPHLVLYGMGTMIGAGIYVLIGAIASHAQYYTPFAFLLAGTVGLLTAISYAELSKNFPFSAGAALFIHQGFKREALSKAVGYLVILTGIVSCSALAKGFAGYAQELVPVNFDVLVFAALIALGLIACWRINMSMWLISIVSIIEILGLVFMVTMLSPNFEASKIFDHSLKLPSGTEMFGLLNASLLAFYAFIGFEDMVNIAEEVKENTMQKGIILAFIFTTVIYLVIGFVAVASVDLALLTNTKAPFAVMLSKYAPWGSKIISVISLIATINGALIQIIMSSRVFYGMARKKFGFNFFAKVNSITHTPINAVVFTTLLTLFFAYLLPIEQLARLTSVIILFIFCLVNLSLIRLVRNKVVERNQPIHLVLPSLALISCIALLLGQLYIEVGK